VLSAIAEGRLVDLGTDLSEMPDGGFAEPGLGARRSNDGGAWGQLVNSALLGTERTDLPDIPVAGPIAAVEERPTETRLLALAGIEAATRRAGFVPRSDDGPLPEPAPPDPRPVVSASAAWLLRRADEEYPELVPEWLALTAAAGKRPPDNELPRLLGLAARSKDVKTALAPLIGPRAEWLIAKMPELAAGLARPIADPEEAWARSSTPVERALVIGELRAIDPSAGRELLEANWSELAPADRAFTIAELRAGLSLADEPFLDQALSDSRGEIRLAAAELLLQVDGSKLARIAEEIARPTLARASRIRASLEAHPPTEWTPLMARLQIPRQPPYRGNERAWWLRSLIGRVRPSHWEDWLGPPPQEAVALAAKSDDTDAIFSGWIDATVRFRDPRWAEDLLRRDETQKPTPTGHDDPLHLLDVIPEPRQGQVAATLMRTADSEFAARVAAHTPAPWSDDVDAAVIRVMRKEGQLISKAFVDLARLAARRMSPRHADELEAVVIGEWGRHASYPALSTYLDTMRFRQRMAFAFEVEGNQ
jgi:hypothetical protein